VSCQTALKTTTEGVLKTMLLTRPHTASLTVVLGLGILGVLGYAFAERQSDHPGQKDKPGADTAGRTAKLHPVMVQDFEKPSSLPKLWVVGIPNESASVGLSTDRPFEGKQCLKLHYHFTGAGQYLGVSNAVKIKMPIHKLHFMLRGDGSGSG
jgi:hypothetical protein